MMSNECMHEQNNPGQNIQSLVQVFKS